METTMNMFATLLPQIPVFLVWLVAMILALVFWKRQPTVSLLVVIALFIFLVLSVADTFFTSWVTIQATRTGMRPQQIATYYAVKSVVHGLCSAVGWALMVAAVFGWRRKTHDASQPQ
jgi:hypothetical protein